jgi:hypothetical protein
MKHFFANASWLKKLASGVAVGVIVGVIVGWILQLGSQRHYDGPPVKINQVINERTPSLQGETWVFADALHLSSRTLAKINGPLKLEREHGVLHPNPFDRWAIANGGVDPTTAVTRVILEGNRSSTVEILGIRANPQCQQPFDGTIFYSPTAGADPVAMMGFDLDSPDSIAYKANGGFVASQPYFETTTISLAPGEHQVIDMVAVTHRHFCRYTFTITVLDGDKISTETLDDNGKPFEVSALLEGSGSLLTHYRSVYVGGVATSDGLFMPVSSHYELP